MKESKLPCHDAPRAPRVVSSDVSPQRRHRHRHPMRKHKTAVVVETPPREGYHHRFWWWWQKKERRTKRRRRRRARRRRRRRRREKCFNTRQKKEYFYYGRICQLCFLRTRLFAQRPAVQRWDVERESSGRMGRLCTGVRRLERRVLGAAKDAGGDAATISRDDE